MASHAGGRSPDAPMRALRACGQSIWLRGLRRRLVESGRLAELVAGSAVGGLTTDLTVLAGALSRGEEYVEPLLALIEEDAGEALLERLLALEAGVAAAALRPLYDETSGGDGLVSVDVDLSAAHDAETLARAARHLLHDAGAPNVMARLPPTNSGFAVFETLIADGLHAHIGPVYGVGSAVRAAEAFARGAASSGAGEVATAVVSFGVASLDNLIDQLLHRQIRAGQGDMSSVESLLGGAATAVAKVAWRRQRELLQGRGVEAAARLLMAWTDLSPADPRQPREHYVEQLVGPGTITLLDGTLLGSLRQRGEINATLGRRVDQAAEVIAELAELDIDAAEVGGALEAKAIRQSRAAYTELRARAERAARALAADHERAVRCVSTGTPWSAARPEIADALARSDELEHRRAVARLWDKDAALWSDDEKTRDLVRNRLGWLDAAASDAADQDSLIAFAAELEAAEVEDVVLLGMGGSSLSAEVCRSVFGSRRLRVLASTVPGQIQAIAGRVDPARTTVVVASKSGTTIEVRALFDWFYALTTPMLDNPGERFVAITDPGTPLEQLAHERRFDRLWLAPPDVGGRFSALTVFGTLPMALMGIDVTEVLASARRMAASCAPEVAAAVNPAARLATALHQAVRGGRDKVTFITPPALVAFGLWAEQLIAESTGKQGVGLIPVVDEPAVDPAGYAADRLFVSLSLRESDDDEHRQRLDRIEAAGHPMMRFELEDRHDLGGEFFRWEAAVALAGALMGINPFDQPDVQASKDRTAELLAAHRRGTPMADRPPLAGGAEWTVFADIERDEELAARQRDDDLPGWLLAHLGRAEPPDYIGLQAFLPATMETYEALQGVRRVLFDARGVATTLGWGPAYLHSTGQLHKGGPDTGLFLQITADDGEDIEVPGAGYGFDRLLRAQSLGDLAALQERGRRVLRVHLREAAAGCRTLLAAAESAFRSRSD